MAIKSKTTKSTTGAKPRRAATTAATKTAAKVKTTAAAAKATAVQGVTQLKVVQPETELRKKELLDAVVTRSGIKKKDAKPVVEAMLEVLGEAVSSGTAMNLQPFGKVFIQKKNDKESATVTILRIRQNKPGTNAGTKGPVTDASS